MRVYILFALLLINFKDLISQDSSGLIIKKGIGWRIDGKRISGSELKTKIYKVPEAIPVYKKAKKNLTLSYPMAISGIIFALLGQDVHDVASPRFGKKFIGFRISGLVLMGTALYCAIRSGKQFKQAIQIRNDKTVLTY